MKLYIVGGGCIKVFECLFESRIVCAAQLYGIAGIHQDLRSLRLLLDPEDRALILRGGFSGSLLHAALFVLRDRERERGIPVPADLVPVGDRLPREIREQPPVGIPGCARPVGCSARIKSGIQFRRIKCFSGNRDIAGIPVADALRECRIRADIQQGQTIPGTIQSFQQEIPAQIKRREPVVSAVQMKQHRIGAQIQAVQFIFRTIQGFEMGKRSDAAEVRDLHAGDIDLRDLPRFGNGQTSVSVRVKALQDTCIEQGIRKFFRSDHVICRIRIRFPRNGIPGILPLIIRICRRFLFLSRHILFSVPFCGVSHSLLRIRSGIRRLCLRSSNGLHPRQLCRMGYRCTGATHRQYHHDRKSASPCLHVPAPFLTSSPIGALVAV